MSTTPAVIYVENFIVRLETREDVVSIEKGDLRGMSETLRSYI